jgi:hypothetical protein
MRLGLLAIAAGITLAACGTTLDPQYEVFYACHAYEGRCIRI